MINQPFLLARRYLFAKKSHNAINIIAWISVLGVATGTFALIVVLSVFNGFDTLISSMFNAFDPNIKITLAEGKFFDSTEVKINTLKQIEGIEQICPVLEENALLRYGKHQYVCTLKGVSNNFAKITGIDTLMVEGKFMTNESSVPLAIAGQGVAYFLNINLKSPEPVWIYMPSRDKEVSLDPEQAFQRRPAMLSGIFSVESEYDTKYLIVPLSLTRELLSLPQGISALEIKTKPKANIKAIQQELQKQLGSKFQIKNRMQQQELFYKIMKTERWAIFFILTFILLVASINIVGSISMLIIEKKNEFTTYRSLGMNTLQIKQVFLFEGWLISLAGAIIGLLLGLLVCWLQMQFGLLKLQGNGTFVIDAYPVSVRISDIFLVFGTVATIGFIASWYPVRLINSSFILSEKKKG